MRIIPRRFRQKSCLVFTILFFFFCVFTWITKLYSSHSRDNDGMTKDKKSHIPAPKISLKDRHTQTLLNEIHRILQRNLSSTEHFARKIKTIIQSSESCMPCSDNAFLKTCATCSSEHFKLLGVLNETESNMTLTAIAQQNPALRLGGKYFPLLCDPKETLAVIIPFRDRQRQLRTLLSVLHPMLQRQQRCYRIFVIEQYGCQAFNKGKLNNAGFLEAIKLFRFNCVIYQDSDVIPSHDHNMYTCSTHKPRHMAVGLNIYKYRLPYNALVGGVLAFTVDQYIAVNGYSNLYWGWGLEDDDMELRMKSGARLGYTRPSIEVARYWAIPHKVQHIYKVQSIRRKPLVSTILRRFRKDGLNTVDYNVVFISSKPLFTHIMLDIGDQPSDFDED